MEKSIVKGLLEKGQRPISDGHDSERIWDPDTQEYVMAYRKVFADKIGIPVSRLPNDLLVHHIDGDRMNNDIDNLMLCTRKAHEKMELLMDEHIYDPE